MKVSILVSINAQQAKRCQALLVGKFTQQPRYTHAAQVGRHPGLLVQGRLPRRLLIAAVLGGPCLELRVQEP